MPSATLDPHQAAGRVHAKPKEGTRTHFCSRAEKRQKWPCSPKRKEGATQFLTEERMAKGCSVLQDAPGTGTARGGARKESHGSCAMQEVLVSFAQAAKMGPKEAHAALAFRRFPEAEGGHILPLVLPPLLRSLRSFSPNIPLLDGSLSAGIQDRAGLLG